jgi:hypothetical protein
MANGSHHYQAAREVTVTTTGNIDNLDTEGVGLLRMNNASAAVIRGLVAGYGGQRLVIQNVGSSTVRVAHQDSNSTAANRCISVSTNGQIIGAGGSIMAVYDDTTARWRISVIEPGDWIPVAYNGANFTGNGSMTWTVAEADQATFVYQQRGAILKVLIFLVDTSVGGTPSTGLLVTVPGGFTLNNTKESPTIGQVVDNGTALLGSILRNTDSNFAIKRHDSANWSTATNATRVFFGADFAVL